MASDNIILMTSWHLWDSQQPQLCLRMQGKFVISQLIIDETYQEVNERIDGTAMSVMKKDFYWLKGRQDGLNEASFLHHGLIFQWHESVFHSLFNLGDQGHSLIKQVIEEVLWHVAFISDKARFDASQRISDRCAVIDMAGGDYEPDHLALGVEHKM